MSGMTATREELYDANRLRMRDFIDTFYSLVNESDLLQFDQRLLQSKGSRGQFNIRAIGMLLNHAHLSDRELAQIKFASAVESFCIQTVFADDTSVLISVFNDADLEKAKATLTEWVETLDNHVRNGTAKWL